MTEGTMSISEAAKMLGLSRQVIFVWVKRGKLPAVKSEGKRGDWRITRSSVEGMLGSPELAISHRKRGLLIGKPKNRAVAYATDMQSVGA